MGRHRRAKLAIGARSTVVKAAAAMGVATALAAGINSAANGPVSPQAAADTTGDPVNLAGSSAPESGQHTAGTGAHESVPTGFATESATAPKLIQPASDVRGTGSGAAAHAAQNAVDSVPAVTATQAPAPAASTAATPSTTAQSSASQTPAPAQGSGTTTSTTTTDSGSTSTGTQASHPVGSLLGGVVGSVGGVVDGLLG